MLSIDPPATAGGTDRIQVQHQTIKMHGRPNSVIIPAHSRLK